MVCGPEVKALVVNVAGIAAVERVVWPSLKVVKSCALAVGIVASGFGVALDVANPIGGLARSDQDGFSAAAFGVGYAAILAGVRSFVFPTPVELSWQAYSSGAVVPPKPSAATVALTGLRPVSVPGGAGMGWGLDF